MPPLKGAIETPVETLKVIPSNFCTKSCAKRDGKSAKKNNITNFLFKLI
jgi:hypothetical protein